MLKVLGCLLLLGCGGAVQYKAVADNRRELELLSGLCAALRQMESDIRLDLTPMPRLLRRLSQSGPPPLRAFFGTLAKTVEGGGALPEAWAACLPALKLDGDALGALNDLRFTGDEEAVRNSLVLAEQRLSALLEETRLRRAGREKLSASLCFSAAAFLILLLI